MQLNYESERPFLPYCVDIYLPEWHLAIEVDGPHHSKKKDEVRDGFLRAYFGLAVRRMNVAKIWWPKAKIEEEVIRFIEEEEPSLNQRLEIWRKR